MTLNRNTNALDKNPFSYLNAINKNVWYHFKDTEIGRAHV